MFREASVFVPEFIVLRWLRWSNGFVGVVEPDQSIVFYGLESCWRSGALVAKVNGFDAEDFSSLEPRIRCFVRLVFLYLSLLFCAGCDRRTALWVLWNRTKALFFMGSNLAGVRVLWSRTKALFFMGSKSHLHEAFFRRVFCLAWARLMLAFGCFGTEALFFMGSKGDVKHSVCVFFAWHGLESCWCFGLFESDADETLSGHRSESTFHTVFCLAEARLLLAFGCFGTEALFFLIWVPKVTWSILSACFLLGMGSKSCWCFGLFESDADETLSSHRSESTFRTVFLLGRGSTAAGVRVFRNRSFVFYVKHSVCVFFAWHGLESCWCFGLFDSDADETLSSHRSQSTAFGCSGTGPKFFLFSFFLYF